MTDIQTAFAVMVIWLTTIVVGFLVMAWIGGKMRGW